jgi:S-adenosylmethionine:tRNA ribosyltransferase-isomerase
LKDTSRPQEKDLELDYSVAGYDYKLPPELIAQNPAVPRDSSRLLVVNSPTTGTETELSHHIFHDLPALLRSGDLLVMNNTRVIPARLYGHKSTGAKIQVLLLEERQYNCWLALVKPGKSFKQGTKIIFEIRGDGGDGGDREDGEDKLIALSPSSPHWLTATVLETDAATGGRLLQFDVPEGKPLVSDSLCQTARSDRSSYSRITLYPRIITKAARSQNQSSFCNATRWCRHFSPCGSGGCNYPPDA